MSDKSHEDEVFEEFPAEVYDDEDQDDPWILCPVCEGEGKTVNPEIDSNGLTSEDFAEDPDFAEAYMSGAYDITCKACKGRTTVRRSVMKRLRDAAERRRFAARENGDFDSYCGAGDYRYGY